MLLWQKKGTVSSVLIFNFVAVCVPLPLCPILLPSLNDTAAPTLSPRFSLLLSSGRLDYVAKEISLFLSRFVFLSSFWPFFQRIPIDLVLMRFECPSVCAERWGENRVGGGWGRALAECRNFNPKRRGWGSQREALM